MELQRSTLHEAETESSFSAQVAVLKSSLEAAFSTEREVWTVEREGLEKRCQSLDRELKQYKTSTESREIEFHQLLSQNESLRGTTEPQPHFNPPLEPQP